jgi:phage-related protein
MADLFDFPIKAEPSGNVLFRTLTAAFGDGYAQTAADGINNRTQAWSITAKGIWTPSTDPEACVTPGQPVRAIADFLDAHGGWKSFRWTAPGDTVERLWKAGSYTKQPAGDGKVMQIAAVFTETFQP